MSLRCLFSQHLAEHRYCLDYGSSIAVSAVIVSPVADLLPKVRHGKHTLWLHGCCYQSLEIFSSAQLDISPLEFR